MGDGGLVRASERIVRSAVFQRIFVPLDGSRRAEVAILAAARLARVSHGTVILMRSSVPLTPYDPNLSTLGGPATTHASQESDDALTYLERLSKTEALAGVQTLLRVADGPAAESILTMSQDEGADLIMLCARGMTGFHRWKLGGVSQHVVRHAVCPVLLLPDPAPGAEPDALTDQLAPIQRALVPLDGSLLAETALLPAINLLAALAPQTGALHVLEVVSPFTAEDLHLASDDLVRQANQYLERLTKQLRDTSTEQLRLTVTSSIVMDTDAAERIITVAEPEHEGGEDAHARGYDIIVMATHGRTGMVRQTLGSITERVLQTTRLPLLIVRSATS